MEFSDWVICEDKNYDYTSLKEYVKNGVLLLELSQDKLITEVLHKPLVTLSIAYNNLESEKWQKISGIALKNELGLKNNTYKILHNYSIYLVKFLKNATNFELEPVPNTKIFENLNISKFSIIIYYIKLVFKIFIRKIKKEQLNWKIGIKKDGKTTLLKQPKKSFWADPFIIKANNENFFVYFEELKSNNLGKISCVELNSNLEIVRKEDIINTDYHLSFPNIFFKEDNYYMIPESSQNNTLQLFECNQFPFKWDFKTNLMENIKLLDAVWIYHNDLYWIFANKIEDFEHDNNEKLYLYYSKNLFSNDWKPHIKNPIITDASLARNAGGFIIENGKLKRVSQNCMKGYGQNIVINEVKLLTKEDYYEEKTSEILPQKGFIGMHTLNKLKNMEVMDYLVKE
ncbi:glucosamine inositolphosphorylceramide transferase family protein [Mariniflexile rhizosphaerae]|uniref:glucosamine inositolphosphorylceramide transferase family protein n=1 Tax=unclassified Mariniflexile TaxID=2643887 RepID=UPI0013C3254A|nr:hypothetical protein [Mariniflexile sp. TRM1-10]